MTPDVFLQAFHAAHPGATARAFAGGRTDDGRSSYDHLADAARAEDNVLDLGCGDGYLLQLLAERGFAPTALIGVDSSESELAAARQRPPLSGVRLLCESASALSLPDASVDCVLSHLAFMLMSDIETVASHVARVLGPGGRFATITGGGPADDEGDGFAVFLRLLSDEYRRANTVALRIGDVRTRHGYGIAQLLPRAFSVAEELLALRLDGTAEEVWDVVSSSYEMFALDAAARTRLRADFIATVGVGIVPCTVRMRLVVAVRE